MKKSKYDLFKNTILTGLLITSLSANTFAQGNADLTKASQDFSSTSTTVQQNAMTGLMALALLAAAAGLISVFQKSNSESENAGKHYMKFFTAMGLFILAWGVMKVVFKA